MTQSTDIVTYFIRLFFINICAYFCFVKITNATENRTKKFIIILILNFIISFIETYIGSFINILLAILISITLYSFILAKIEKIKLGYSLIITIISYAICLIFFCISVLVSYIPYKLAYDLIGTQYNYDYISLIVMLIIQVALTYGFFKIKRFKHGFGFLHKLNNDFTDSVIINISIIIVLIYSLIGISFENYDENITRNIEIIFIIVGISMIISIQKTFTMYYKQKLMKQTLEDYERELKEKNTEIERINNEKFAISKITHEFYNRQKSLEMAVRNITDKVKVANGNFETEIAEELEALDKIHNLSKEYSQKLEAMKSLPTLPLTEISEIDDMFKYMQSECAKTNIDFKLKIAGNIFYLVNNIIPTNKLVTMIGDHIRDAIIATNFSSNTNKEIFTILGIKDKKYELCIYDTGIEFEIDTLLKLGVEQVTTHKDTGGSGIGFITTFETLNETKASLIIREEAPSETSHYTKSVTIRFDNKHQYKICSYRANEIKEKLKESKSNRKIIIENI